MRILSHRGLWIEPSERNTERAFERSFAAGLGLETDLRDHDGILVVAHDPATGGARAADRLFALHARSGPLLPLALNIKADGVAQLVAEALAKHRVAEAFCFDMTVPEALVYLQRGMRVFTRHSEVERVPAFYERAHGVWLDSFESEWFAEDDVRAHLDAGKQVCIVSPELHGRPPETFWGELARWRISTHPQLMVCTDRPADLERILGG